ncbi:hypothetical protein A2304_02740 [Candidatus Uhrbacteria bacterium RIFOXYB2_FULL_57_15]|uniref:Uncharacterized protein n=1 Tax=Candidatus Uhrbacteria bacterium RIFOXYB2_FULL_57_15 TaxID=1802422 RepID=A0A1F7W9J8_9BACT|nr:MAG: hypothetical protein A2304_02740 [Candidatus Uhrbacteria bacterium RIFOXYB2_FULL_57_15]OGM00259.1 MAG: hypothetical protein A2501_01870 [Candidatus Uhrbacteria bacterium RIFOXYC12_FULL_57_11]
MGFGCSPTDRLAEKATESAINAQLDGQANVDIEEGMIRYEDAETGAVSAWGENIDVPETFPSDVPRYENGNVVGVTISEDGAWISYATSDSVEMAISWYEDRLVSEGWTRQASYSIRGSEMRSFAKDDATITVSASTDESSDAKTSVMIVRSAS